LDIAQKPTAYSSDTDYLGEKMTTTDHWADDCLDRKQEARDVIAFLQSMHGQGYSDGDHLQGKKHFTLNITAEWGAGKTFFLRRLEQELKKIGHPVIYFDAWKNDLSTDPIGAFIAQVTKGLLDQLPQSKHKTSFKKAAGNIFKAVAKTGASTLTKKFLGLALDELQEEFDGAIDGIEPGKIGEKASEYITKLIDEHAKQPVAIDAFKGSIKAISADIYNDSNRRIPIYIIIDELDRCRPTYAVQLLESVKHIFETDGIYIIFGTNKNQLIHTINKVYGQGFDSSRYLRRFFQMEYVLSVPSASLSKKLFTGSDGNFSKTHIVRPQNQTLEDAELRRITFENLMICLQIQPREQENIFFLLSNASKLISNESQNIHFYPLLIICTAAIAYEDRFSEFKAKSIEVSQAQNNNKNPLVHLVDISRAIKSKIIFDLELAGLANLYKDLEENKRFTDVSGAGQWYENLQATTKNHDVPMSPRRVKERYSFQSHMDLILRASKFVKL
jgi:hypothetical protein